MKARSLVELLLCVPVLLVVCILAEGPARWLITMCDISADGVVHSALVTSYRPIATAAGRLPTHIQEAREAYLDWFAPDWMDESFLHLD